MGAGNADVRGEAEEFTETLGKFLSTLGAVIRSAAEWLGLVVVDLASSGTGDLSDLSDQAGSMAAATRSRAKTLRKKSRNLLVKLALVALFFWWLDRDLSETKY